MRGAAGACLCCYGACLVEIGKDRRGRTARAGARHGTPASRAMSFVAGGGDVTGKGSGALRVAVFFGLAGGIVCGMNGSREERFVWNFIIGALVLIVIALLATC